MPDSPFYQGILFLSYCPTVGGISTYQAEHLNWLSGKIDRAYVDEVMGPTLTRVEPESLTSLVCLELPVWSQPRLANELLIRWAASHPPQVIFIDNPGMLVKGWSFLRYARTALRAKLHIRMPSGVFVLRLLPLEWISSVLALSADDVVYVSEFTRRHWQRRYPWMRHTPSRIISNGVRLPSTPNPPRNPDLPLRIGFVGRLSPEKDPELFCQVASLAQTANQPWEFHVYGDGSLGAELSKRFGNRIFWHGTVHNVDDIFRNLDILLMTSRVENSPHALLEAKSYGVPTVAPAVGGIPELLMNGVDGILSEERSASALLAALATAAGMYDQLRCGCLERRLRYTIDAVGQLTWGKYLT